MKKFALVSILLSFGIFLFSQNLKLKSEHQLWRDGMKYYNEHSYRPALRHFDELIKRYPRSRRRVESQILKGKAHIKLREYSKGINYLEALTKQNRAVAWRPDVYEEIAGGYFKWSRYSNADKAITHYKKALYFRQRMRNQNRAMIAIYEKLIQVYRYKNYYKEQKTYQDRTNARDRDITASYNAMIALATDHNSKAEYMFKKAVYIRDHYYYNPRKKDIVLAAFKLVVRTYPRHNLAVDAQLQVGELYRRYAEYIRAIAEFQKLIKTYPNSKNVEKAHKYIELIKAPRISVSVQSTVKPGEKTKLSWQIRNVKKVYFAAYQVDLFDVLKDVENLGLLQNYSLKGKKITTKWDFATPDKGKHQYHRSDGKINPFIEVPIEKSGAYIVTGTGVNPENKGYNVKTLIIVSKLGLIMKSGKENTLFYTVDSLSGKPIQNTELLVQRYVTRKKRLLSREYYNVYEYKDLKTSQDGSGIYRWGEGKSSRYWNRNLFVIAKNGDDYAVSNSRFYYSWYGYRRDYKIYGYTDRPVYRPKNKVEFKQVIRKYVKGKYENYVNGQAHVRIVDPKGNNLYDRSLTTNEYGTVSGSIT
ncbi:MAG: MG2 domain-containing protein, partial [Spirochaetota bacterium]|nr:MG2 domain-containing protein [Spirochaetota bacterium]